MVHYTDLSRYLLLVVSCLLLLTGSVRCQCDLPIKEGHEGQIACNAPSVATRLLWQLQRDGEWVNVSTCEFQGASNDFFPTAFKAQYMNTTSGHKSLLTVVKANRSETTFKCVVMEGGIGEVQCNIIVYDGPKSVFMYKTDIYFDLCPSDDNNLTITCTVPIDQVYPAPLFSIVLDSKLLVDREPGLPSYTDYDYTYTYRPENGGFFEATCRAENAVFDDETSKTVTIEVREPPIAKPKLSAWYFGTDLSLNKVTLKDGDTLTATCHVEGGIPEVKSVSLQCGSKQVDVPGQQAKLTLVVTTSLNGTICSCSASHVTNCYTQTASGVLLITTKPSKDEQTTVPAKSGDMLTAGLAAGLGGSAVIGIWLAVVIYRCKKRRSHPQQPQQPKHVAQWVNNISLYDTTPDRYVPFFKEETHAESVAGDSNIYEEIPSLPDYTTPPNNRINAPHGHRNNLYEGDYIHPA